ncbi:MAG TPA: KH domain-containing protein [Trichormus sp. M33_DOE_039]|nr:KH domain-containing protein [Trichormus sp. M33_DOE_039]
MSLNRSVPQPHHNPTAATASPNYAGLVKFLMQPFLEFPESLSVDCEISQTLKRVWIRIAFESTDKGKVFGRGGRNIQAIRTVIAAAAQLSQQSVYLDIYGNTNPGREGLSVEEDQPERSPTPRTRERRNSSRPVVKPRSR